jgi:hypothetical protein
MKTKMAAPFSGARSLKQSDMCIAYVQVFVRQPTRWQGASFLGSDPLAWSVSAHFDGLQLLAVGTHIYSSRHSRQWHMPAGHLYTLAQLLLAVALLHTSAHC